MASQILGRKGLPSQAPTQAHTQLQSTFHKVGKSSISLDPNVDLQRKLRAKQEEDAQVLRDPEDEGIQQILHSQVEPTLTIDEFVAVDSQLPETSSREKEPVHVQCEALWRDINRMIDRIGLNSRALQSFIKGHTTLDKPGGRTKDDLDRPDDWVLVEAEDIGAIVEGELTRDLEEGRVKHVEETKDTIREMLRDIAKLRAKQEDMHKIIMAHVDPEQASLIRSLPLNAEQAAQQNELRKAYANVTQLLAEAEESLTLLRAKIASAGGASNRKAGAPTVDAVIRTINKLTTMAEKRSVDVDVLETQMRRLRVGTGSPAPRSREGSPFVGGTPSHRRSLLISPATNLRESFASSVASYGARGTPPRKKMSMFTEEERKALQSKQGRRKAKLGMLRDALERVGPQVSTLQDDD
jgi:nucleoporin NUP159